MLRAAAMLIALGLVAGGLGLAGVRVAELERGELELESAARSLAEWRRGEHATRVSARLLSAELSVGERVVFELCSPRRLEPKLLEGAFSLAVLNLDRGEKMLLVPLDAAHLEALKSSARGSCLPLGGGVIERPGTHSLEVVWLEEGEPSAAVQAVPLVGRVLARRALAAGDVGYVLAIAAGALLFIAALWSPLPLRLPLRLPEPSATEPGPRQGQVLAELPIALAAFAALAAATQLPLYGATLALAKGAVLVAVQVGAALLLVRAAAHESRLGALRLIPPARPVLWLPAAVGGALLLWGAARISLALVPATSEAPIQTFVSWPSGLLSFGALGVLLPVAEEVFFRGYLYRSALRLGRTAAFVLTVVLFVALHAQQSWGNWGGLLAIALTGTALTGLRALSGSVLVPALAHLLYNFALSVASF